jgi:hypothetical protein
MHNWPHLPRLITTFHVMANSRKLMQQQHPTSNNQDPTSNIQHPTSNIQQPTTNNQQPTTNNNKNNIINNNNKKSNKNLNGTKIFFLNWPQSPAVCHSKQIFRSQKGKTKNGADPTKPELLVNERFEKRGKNVVIFYEIQRNLPSLSQK